MARTPLDSEEILRQLSTLPGWELRDGRLRRAYEFRDFVEAFAFMTAVALRVQEMDHHPEWSNVYNRVEVTLTTHDSGGVTKKDLQLARAMDRVFDRRGVPKP